MDFEQTKTYYIKSWFKLDKIIQSGMIEIVQRFELKRDPNKGITYCFVKKNTNRYFRKHLGFTYGYCWDRNDNNGSITINDFKKFSLFVLKYGISL